MSAPTAILCSGQGTQHPGMFDLVAQAPEARPILEALCRAHDSQIAIINGKDFFVVGGERGKLEVLGDDALKAGARRADLLRVAVASHTPLLAEASRRFGEALAGFRLPDRLPEGVRLLSGIDGDAVFDVLDGRRKLAVQIQPHD